MGLRGYNIFGGEICTELIYVENYEPVMPGKQ